MFACVCFADCTWPVGRSSANGHLLGETLRSDNKAKRQNRLAKGFGLLKRRRIASASAYVRASLCFHIKCCGIIHFYSALHERRVFLISAYCGEMCILGFPMIWSNLLKVDTLDAISVRSFKKRYNDNLLHLYVAYVAAVLQQLAGLVFNLCKCSRTAGSRNEEKNVPCFFDSSMFNIIVQSWRWTQSRLILCNYVQIIVLIYFALFRIGERRHLEMFSSLNNIADIKHCIILSEYHIKSM